MTTNGEISRRILIVEDDESIRGAFGILLEDSGYSVETASTGKLALSKAASFQPWMILMDMGLPDGNGMDFTRQLKADPETSEAIVVALTGRATPEDREACLIAGCSDYMAKPVGAKQLLANIRKWHAEAG